MIYTYLCCYGGNAYMDDADKALGMDLSISMELVSD